MLKTACAFAALACLTLTAVTRADDNDAKPATLHAGDSAPALTPSKWVKGEPVNKIENGKIYVVEFWATWCGPCRKSIPHLSELQQQYKDVTFIGQNCWEQDQAAVGPFVEKMGDKMNYRVALDDTAGNEKGKMAQAWMEAAGQHGIPTAFLIGKDAKIAWIGHPMELEPILKAVVAGTFDARKEAESAAAREAIQQKLEKAAEAGNWDAALAAVDEMQKAESDPDHAKELGLLRYNILLRKKAQPKALALAKELSETLKDDPAALNELAWSMVDPESPVEKPDLDLAERLALRADEVSKGNDPQVLDTLARVYAAKGDMDKAVQTQTKAVGKAEDGDMKDQLKKTLAEYMARKK